MTSPPTREHSPPGPVPRGIVAAMSRASSRSTIAESLRELGEANARVAGEWAGRKVTLPVSNSSTSGSTSDGSRQSHGERSASVQSLSVLSSIVFAHAVETSGDRMGRSVGSASPVPRGSRPVSPARCPRPTGSVPTCLRRPRPSVRTCELAGREIGSMLRCSLSLCRTQQMGGFVQELAGFVERQAHGNQEAVVLPLLFPALLTLLDPGTKSQVLSV